MTHLHRNIRPRSAGFTLIECLMYATLLAVLCNICLSVYVSVSRISTMGMAMGNRLEAVENLRADFARSVREAEAIVPAAASYKTGPEQLVMALPKNEQSGDAPRYVVWGRIGKDGKLARLEFADKNGDYTPLDLKTYGVPVRKVRFSGGDAANARLASMDFTLKNAGRKFAHATVPYHFQAALRSQTSDKGGGV